MANYGPADVTISYDNSGGTPVDISAYVLEINDVDVEEITEEVHPFGSAWETHQAVGVGRMPDIELTGLYESATLDPLFANRLPEGPAATTRTLTVLWGGTKSVTVETLLMRYRRSANREQLTRYTATLKPTGAVTEA